MCTEDAFPSKRWKQLAAAFISSHQGLGYSMDKMSDKLYIEHAATIVSPASQHFTRVIYTYVCLYKSTHLAGGRTGHVVHYVFNFTLFAV